MDDTVKPPPYRATPERLRRDQARIEAELAGIDGGTDPFPAAVRATRMPMVITNPRRPDNPIVFVNDAFCRLTGYAREEILGRNCRFLQGPETDPETVRLIREAIVAPRSIEIDIRNHKKDGTPFWNRLLLAPVNDAGGDLAYFFASQLDVTVERERLVVLEDENAALTAERRANLERLAFSEESLRLATEAAEVGTWDLDLTTDVLTWSDRTKAMFGISPGVPCSMADFYAGLHPDDLEVTSAAFASALDPARRATYDVEYRTVGKEDGVVRWVAAKGKGLFDARGACVRALGTAIDITARRRAEEVRQANEARLRFLDALGTETAGNTDAEGILSVTTRMVAGHLRLSNCAYADMDPDGEGLTIRGDWSAEGSPSIVGRYRLTDFGTLAATCLRSGELLVVGDVRSELPAADAASFQAVGVAAVACMPLVKDGRLTAMMAIHDRVARAWSGDDLAVLREVTERCWAHIERVRADAALREAAGQLAALNATLEQRVEERTARLGEAEAALRQSQKLEAVGQLTGGVAHDFNNLLNVVLLNLDRVERGLPEESPLRKRLRDAVKGAERAATMTHKLLAFARRQPLSPVSTDVNAQIAAFAEFLRGTIGSRIRLETDLASDLPRVSIDPNQLENAILNLAVNARDAMPDGGTLTLATRTLPGGEGLAVEVSDTGTGMTPEVEARAFEPFFTTKPLGQGTGLGLSQVFGFAQQSGGNATFVRGDRGGTTVRLSFPAQGPAAERPVPTRPSPAAESGFAPPRLPPVAVAG